MSREFPLSRRRVLAGLGSAAIGAVAGVTCPRLVFAQTKKAIKFTLPWVAEGSNMFTFVAKGMGIFDKHGLDVDIARGSGSVAASQAIGEGRFDFGLSTPSVSILQASKGLPTFSLAACAYDATMGVAVLADGPIKTPKDLEGRKMASVVTSGDYPFVPLFAEKAGVDLAKVTRIQVDNKVRDRLLPEGTVDAISGYATSIMPNYAATGVKARFMLFSEFGILNYGTALMTQPKRAAEEPELCAAVVDSVLEGLKATMLDPAEAVKVFLKQVPELALAQQAREQMRVGTGIMLYVSTREVAKNQGLGYSDPKDYETMTDLVMKYLVREGDPRPEVAAMVSNKFVGHVKLSPSEWEQAQKNSGEFRSYLT